MDKIVLEGTEDTPKVVLDPSNNEYEISGRSIPEDATAFYKPVMDWLEGFSPSSGMKLSFKLQYFNTSSSKVILDIISKLENFKDNGKVSVLWHYHEDDEDMLEAGEEYAELADVPFEFQSYN